jgi:hypothetical protein
MNPRLFLKVMVSLMLIPSFICLFLPDTIAGEYVKILSPLCLLIGSMFSLRVASIYKNWLWNSFFFLALFLFFMMLANIDPLWDIVVSEVGKSSLPFIVLPLQWITYSMLVASSYYMLKITEVRKISKKGWVIIVVMLFIATTIALYPIFEQLFSRHYIGLYTISLLIIRFLDVAITLMLLPVVLLYAEQMRLEGRESLTFTTIVCGIILSITVAYVYEIAFGVPLYVVYYTVYHTGSILDALYLFSYLIIAVGLYVLKKYDEWGFQMIEKSLEEE